MVNKIVGFWLYYNHNWLYIILLTTNKSLTLCKIWDDWYRGNGICFDIQMKRNCQFHIVEWNQSKYINDLLRKYGMKKCKPIFNPLESILKLTQDQFLGLEEKRKNMFKFFYKSGVGSLTYAMVCKQRQIA